MKNLIFGFLILGLTIGSAKDNSKEVELIVEDIEVVLEDVEVVGVNYNYLNAIGYRDAAEPVKLLEQKVASFDLKNSDINTGEKQNYNVSFEIPEGKISAVFDNEGEIISTTEMFTDISLPLVVSNAIVEKYPGWKITGDVYIATYVKDGELNKTYNLFIEKTNIGKTVIKTDESGNFL